MVRRISFFACLLMATMATAADVPALLPSVCTEAPTLDGRLEDPCWQDATWITDFTLPGRLDAPAKSIRAAIGYDADRLYLAFRCEEPSPEHLRLRHTSDHPDIWQDDVIEVFLRTGTDRMAIEQLLVNAAGARWSLRRRPGGYLPWPPDWPAAAQIEADHWAVELAVPWTDIGVDSASAGRLVEVKFGREDYTAQQTRLSVWPPGTVYAGIDDYGRLYLNPANRFTYAAWDMSADGHPPAAIESGDEVTLGSTLRLTTGERAVTRIQIRPETPHELEVTALGSGTVMLNVDGAQMTRIITGSDTLHWNGVTDDQRELPVEVIVERGTLDLSLRLVEAPRLPVAGPAIPLRGGDELVIEHVAVKDARAVRGFIGTPFDGSVASRSWNGQVWEYPQAGAGAGVGYAYHNNDGLHVQFADDGGFDAAQIRGGIRADLHVPAISYSDDSDSPPRYRFAGRTLRSRALFADRVQTSSLSLTHVTDGVIADAAFYRLHKQIPETAGGRWPLGQTWTPDRQMGIDAVGISFDAQRAPRELTLIVDDAFDPRLQLMTVDVEISGSGPTLVVLDHIDQVIPAGKSVSIRAIDAQGNPWTAGAEVHLYTTTPLAALQQALPHRKFLVKTLFACLSEPRPWTGLPREGSIEAWFQQHRMGNQLEQLFTAVDDALRLDPVDEQMQQYEQWLYRARIRPELKTPILSDDSPDAPQWARWARAAWLTARRVPAWWLDHRLVETGEFGGAVGDDTDLYQNFVDFAYFESGGVAARLQEAAARLAHLAELTTLTGGINRSTMDPLHAYEEGLNQEALMAAWTYGDPVYLERCMAAARSVADVTVVTDRGHRHFRSQLIGEDARADTTTDVDGQAHPSMWHPALEVLWYNEHPVISQWLQEWADGWLDHFEPGRYAHAVDVASERVEGANQRPLYGGYGGQGSAFAFLATITGDRDYAAPFFEAYSAGQTSTSPADLILDLLHRFGADAFGGHLETLPLQGPAAAVVHGDLDALVEALQQDVAEIETFERMYTSAEPFTDRIFLSAIRNASICYTGGYASRNKFNRSHAVSWSGFSTDYAAFVERAGPESFRARLYNFSKARRLGAARFWQLAHGRYRIHRGPDADDDGRIDGQAETEDVIIRRGEPIDIDLQPGGSVIEVELLEALPSLQSEADLALSPLDITIVGDAILGSVHNIGRKSAHAVVTLTPAGGGAAQQIDLGQIDPPDDLVPRRQAFHFDGLSRSDLDGIIEVDAQHVVSEITELNNVVDLRQIHQTLRWQGEVETAIAPQRTD